MKNAITWLGEVVGGFSAASLVYVVVGGLAGLLLAVPFDGKVVCWPTELGFSVATRCDNAVADALWFGVVELPSLAIYAIAIAVYVLIAPPVNLETAGSYYIIDPVVLWSSAIIAAALCITGVIAWSSRSQAVAWVLLLLLSAEIGARAIGV